MDELLNEFKSRMHIFHSSEDESLKEILNKSFVAIQSTCGSFDLDKNMMGRELVLERSRYVYNEQLQFFHKNFSTLITDFGLQNQVYEGDAFGTDEIQK
ncbi:phage gp6-like head-tail connector protein [Staphylococcus condimenti]|nr:phage gp6-like head-tail connector protein [Staphylococcus condimenti]MDK8646353.1 phage gp6-like head-tail connector protein [Staphylococcus condimenti]